MLTSFGIHLACVADRQNRRYRPGILWHVRLQCRLAFIERSWDQVWGHLPANVFTEEIEMKDRVAIMLFILNSVFVSTGCDSDKPERINISILSGCCRLWTLRDHKTKNKTKTYMYMQDIIFFTVDWDKQIMVTLVRSGDERVRLYDLIYLKTMENCRSLCRRACSYMSYYKVWTAV